MKHFVLLLLSLLLIAGVTTGLADDPDRALDVMLTKASANLPQSTDVVSGGWIPLTLDPLSITYGGAQYVAPSTVYLTGYSSTADFIWRSYDNGGSWTKLVPPSNNKGIVIAARDSNLVLCGTFGGTMLRTTNGGTKWDTVYQHTDYIDGVAFIGKDTAIAVGDMDASGPLLIKSTNAGATWTRLPLPSAADSAMAYAYATYRQAIAVYNSTIWVTVYKSGSAPRIMKSTNSGVTWTSFPVSLVGGTANNYYMRSINFLDDSIGFVVGRQVTSSSSTANYIQRTTDGGLTWGDTLSLQAGAHSDALARAVKPIPGTTR